MPTHLHLPARDKPFNTEPAATACLRTWQDIRPFQVKCLSRMLLTSKGERVKFKDIQREVCNPSYLDCRARAGNWHRGVEGVGSNCGRPDHRSALQPSQPLAPTRILQMHFILSPIAEAGACHQAWPVFRPLEDPGHHIPVFAINCAESPSWPQNAH